MVLQNADEFVLTANLPYAQAKELRLCEKNKTYLLDASLAMNESGLILSGVAVMTTSTRSKGSSKALGRQQVVLKVGQGVFLLKNMGCFDMIPKGYTQAPMMFDVNQQGQWGVVEEGIFQENTMFSTRDVPEKRNDFDTENWGFKGSSAVVPKTLDVAFQSLGSSLDLPVGNTVKTLIDRYVKEILRKG